MSMLLSSSLLFRPLSLSSLSLSLVPVEVVKQVERVNIAEAELVGRHHVVEVGLDVGVDHLLESKIIEIGYFPDFCGIRKCGEQLTCSERPFMCGSQTPWRWFISEVGWRP